jgi:hypothetical protein
MRGCKTPPIPDVNRKLEKVLSFTLLSFKPADRSLSGRTDEDIYKNDLSKP